MGKRSRSKTPWPKRHDTETKHTVRKWICAGCRKETQLLNCADGAKRCPRCKAAFDRERERLASQPVVTEAPMIQTPGPLVPAEIQPAGQVVVPPRVG